MVTKMTRTKGASHAQNEMEKLMHHDKQDLLSMWEGWHWNDNKGRWRDPEPCATARREEVEVHPPKQDVHESAPEKCA